jgi:hypothetical protein
MSAKMSGDHKKAVALYRELLPHVRVLDELEALDMPQGMSSQLVERAIELAELRLVT